MSDYDATRENAGVLVIPELVLRVRGKDARRYLHRMLANDVQGLRPGEGRRALALDVKGHVVGDPSVLCTGEDEFLLLAAGASRAGLAKLIAFYALADEVEVDDLTDEQTVVTVQGPKAMEVVSGRAPGPMSLGRALDHVATKLADADARVVRRDHSGLGGLDVVVAAPDADKVRQSLVAAGACELSAATLDLLRLEAGRAVWGPDFGAETIPQEALLEAPEEAALSFDKGCFLGQEVVARLRFRGHVNKRLVGLVLEGDPPAPGTALRKADKEVGKITSSGRSPRLGTIALGYVRREHAPVGSEVDAGGQKARVVARPFGA